MKGIIVALMVAGAAPVALADRISNLGRTDLRVYTAKLYTAGYYFYLQGKAREDVAIHWHGDETRNEIEFVGRVLDAAYARAEALRREAPQRYVSEQTFGDEAYEACISEARP